MNGVDLQNITQETAVKLVLGGVAGAAVAYYGLQGLRQMLRAPRTAEQSEARKQVLLFAGSMALVWGLKEYGDISNKLQFLIDPEAPPPDSWAEFEAAMREQADKFARQARL